MSRLDRIVPRLLLGFFLLSPLPLACLAWFYIQAFQETLQQTVLTNLSSIANKKVDQISTHFYERIANSKSLAYAGTTRQALRDMSEALQRHGIASQVYQDLAKFYQHYFSGLFEHVGYYDVLLNDQHGNVVLSLRHEADLGSNLHTGPYRDSTLAVAHREAMTLLDTQITPVARYAPSGQRLSIFVVTPIIENGRVLGTIALQLDLQQLQNVTADTTGLGQSGETVLAQRDSDEVVYVAPLRRVPRAAYGYRLPFAQTSLPMQQALQGQQGQGLVRDYAGVPVMAIWRYIPELRWGMVVKIDRDEALAPARALRRDMLLVLGVLWLISAWAAWRFGRLLVKPVLALTRATQQIAQGETQQRAEASGLWEFRQLAASFNQMTDLLVEERAELENRVAARTRELREISRLHTAILDQAGFAIIATTPEGIITVFNHAAENMLGYRAEELIGQKTPAVFHDPEQVAQRARQFGEELGISLEPGFEVFVVKSRLNLPNEHEWTYLRPDGSRFPVNLAVTALRDESGAITGFLGIAIDISKRKRAEEALATNEKRLRSVFQRSNTGIAFADERGNLVELNASLASFLGYAPDELLGVNFGQFTHPEDLTAEIVYLDEIREGLRDDYRMEKRYLTRSGQIVWGDVSVTAIRDEIGRVINFVGVVVDITARKQSELEYHTILQTTRDGFWINDLQGHFLEVNTAYCRMIGYDRETLLEMCISDVEAVETPEETAQHIRKILREGSDLFETRHRCRDGQLIDLEVSVNYLAFGGGRLVVFLRDISARKQVEAELRAAKQAAEQSNRAKSEFLANMSHEIRTPLNAILGLTQLVLESPLTAQQADYLRKVHSSSRALLGILNDILDYSKIEAGRMEIERVPLSVERILRDVADLFSARVEEKGLELFIDISSNMPTQVLGDPLRLMQVLNNLVGNAVKFTTRGEIVIRAEIAAEFADEWLLRFAVRDTGIGLSPEYAERLFQAFTQADSSITRQFGGTGLGLTISQRLVRLMGGEIGVISQIGQGATFHFTIRVGRLTAPIAKAADEESKLPTLRVLIVDDQETARAILYELLTAWGLRAETVASGEVALTRIAEAEQAGQPFDAVLLDWRMPGMDGLQVARELENQAEAGQLHHPLVVVMVTAHDQARLRAAAGSIRLHGVLEKPVTPSHLFDVLMKSQHAAQRLSFAPHSAPILSPAQRADFAGARILLVEDNALNQEVAVQFLTRRGAKVVVAQDGQEAVEQAAKQTFDAVLMDLHMPVMDGFEATRRIRALPQCVELPIIAMTAAVLPEDRERCLAAGMNSFVAKPVDPDELRRVLQRWLPAPTESANPDVGSAATRDDEAGDADLCAAGFDIAAALRRLDGDRALWRRLLEDFAARYHDAPTHLQALLDRGQHDAAAEYLHAMKGASANLGATTLAQAIAELERELRDNTVFDLGAFTQQWQKTHAAIQQAGNVPDAAATTVPAALDTAMLRSTLEALQTFLRQYELPPDELLDALRQQHTQTPRRELEMLLRQLDQFSYDKALDTLQQLLQDLSNSSQ